MKISKLNLLFAMLFTFGLTSPLAFAAERMGEGGTVEGSVSFLDDFSALGDIEATASSEVAGTQSTKAPENMAGRPVIPIASYGRSELEGDNAPRCRKHPLLKRMKTHAGTDMGTYQGRSVISTLPGTVVLSKDVGGYGNFIVIKHKLPDGKVIYSRYGHLFKNSSKCKMAPVGKKVAAGDKIGCVGSTGLSSGPHLHFEIRGSADGGVIYDSKHFVLNGGKFRKAPVCG